MRSGVGEVFQCCDEVECSNAVMISGGGAESSGGVQVGSLNGVGGWGGLVE